MLALGFDLSQKQTLKLAMTPELQQSINILCYSAVELLDFLHKQTVENPFLDLSAKNEEAPRISEGFHAFDARSAEISMNGTNNRKDYDPINHFSANTKTLERHLMEQLAMVKHLTELQQDILKFLIGNINDNGYLEIEAETVACIFSVSINQVEELIGVLQSFDPVGVGAKNLKDCLLIQLRSMPDFHELAYLLVENNLEDVAEKRFKKLANLYHTTLPKIQEAVDFIKTLNPRPASNFGAELTHYITPDVIVEKKKEEFIITVNDSFMPKLTVNSFYKDMLEKKQLDSAHNYLKDKWNEANMILKGIQQRHATIYKVAKAIVEEQQEFFQTGAKGLKPMNLKNISSKLGLHESTVSRATHNKYIQTPYGLFTFKDFFTKGFAKTNGSEVVSSAAVKEKIKAIIHSEEKKNPCSDLKIAKLLEQQGLKISRRTVAKYREELGIPGSSKRKRFS